MSRKINKKMKILLALVCFVFSFCFIGGGRVFAAGGTVNVSGLLEKKMVMQGVQNCYSLTMKQKIKPSDYKDVASLLDGSTHSARTPLITGMQNGNYDTTNVFGDGVNGIKCDDFMKAGKNSESGITKYHSVFKLSNTLFGNKYSKGVPPKGDDVEIINGLRNMGYDIPDLPSDLGKCYAVMYTIEGQSESHKTNTVCKNKDGRYSIVDGSGASGNSQISNGFKTAQSNTKIQFVTGGGGESNLDAENSANPTNFNGDSLMELVRQACMNNTRGQDPVDHCWVLLRSGTSNNLSFTGAVESTSTELYGEGKRSSTFLRKGLNYISNGTMSTPGKFTIGDNKQDATKRILYQRYLTGYFGANVSSDQASGKTITWLNEETGEIEKTKVSPPSYHDETSKLVVGVGGNGYLNASNKLSYNDLIGEINKMRTDYDEGAIQEAIAGSTVDGETGEGEVTCMSAGGAKALAWIICPVLDFLADSSQTIYSDYVGPRLQVNSSLLFSGEDEEGVSNIRQAWETFRDIGNIAFIVLLLVVIFSQLTGVGIDNYGIKKILPKLIVSAILINLSYLICVLLVDLSNVFGVSFQGLFSSLPPADGEVSLQLATSSPSKSVGLGGFIPAALIASIVAVPVIFANPAILLTALVSALSIIISLFFLFILLSVREAAIIVLIVASPLAVICYMLPNMKKMFERWWKLFSGLLLVYPVSSLLVGAGNYISKLLLKTSADGGFLNLFTAMIIGVAPIFFIPTVLKGSFSAMGKIGGTLAGLGKTVSGGASKRMRDSEGYKNLQESGKMWNTKLKAGIGPISGKPRELGRLGTLMRGGKRGVARARAQYRSDQATLGAQNDLLNNGIFGSRLEADKKAQALKGYQEQFANMGYDQLMEQVGSAGSWLGNDDGEQRMSALIQAMESNGMESNIYDMLRTNNVSNMTGVMSTLAGSNNKILKAYGKKGRGVDYSTFVGGTGANTLSEYAKSKGADFVNGLDDKALAEIKANGSHVMSTAQLVQAASQLTEQSAINEVNDMLGHRNDVALSGEQLANLNSSTVGRLLNTGSRMALITASDDLATNIDLRNKLDPEARRLINRARVTSGRQAI